MKEYGYIKLDRSIAKWRWFKNVNTCHLFMHLLLMANYSEAEFQSHNIKRGQIATSLNNLSQQSGLTFQQIRTALNHLKSTNDISIETTTKYTIITVNNYDKYILSTHSATNNQQTTNKQITNEQQQYNNKNKNNKYNKNNNKFNNFDSEEEHEKFLRAFKSKSLFTD